MYKYGNDLELALSESLVKDMLLVLFCNVNTCEYEKKVVYSIEDDSWDIIVKIF